MVEPSPRRITVVAHEVRSDGGMEKAMMETLLGLLAQGWQIRLLAQVCEIDSQPGLRWTRIRTPRRPFAIAFPMFALVAGLLILFERPAGAIVSLGAIIPNRVDFVTVQFCHAGFASRRLARASRNSWLYRLNGRVAQVLALSLERWCYRPARVRRMTAVSALVKGELQTHYQLEAIPVDIIPNGVDLDRFRPDASRRARERKRLGLTVEELTVVFVGGDWARKGLDIAMTAASTAGWTLIVVGGGDVAAWRARARELGARVRFCGHLPNPEDVLCAADAFILPSNYEGFALVAIEAAATGLPLLVTEATGAGTLAERSGTRSLPREAAAFTAELRRLGSDPGLRREIGSGSRAAAEELAWPRIVAAYARCYASDAPAPHL